MMKIPARLAKLLRKDAALESSVVASVEEFLPWLESGGKRPTFFPDYTDHSVQHIEEVLETASSLIRDEAWASLTPADAAVLVLAALLHDSAMHLTREGFQALVRPGTRWIPVEGFGDPPWPQLWADFCIEARRFDQRRLLDLFGDPEPVAIPDLDELRLDDRGRRVIGEFIRRHHPRLAHEIALHGVPGATDEPLRLRTPDRVADVAGLVARSHGLSARACLPHLGERHHSRVDPYGVHAVFLIVLLRVADYLQIQPGRAPALALKVHRIQSPYSAVEWKVHASVTQVQESDDDPEAIRIIADPADVATYLRLKDWLEGLQDEIDASWAVLGEVFSRQQTKKLDRLGIKLRRVHSNLDDTSAFIPGVPYLRRHVTFTAATADLLKLLIGPFYGDRPEIGVRELIQNAVDAVRELDSLRERGFALGGQETIQGADVLVELEERDGGAWRLTVADRGIGMSPEVVCNYFLRAGASFRNSDAWLRRFTDQRGSSVILRSGRFGVGALSAFLLGEELQVSTRRYDEETGLSFSATVETPAIEIRPAERPTGTTISIGVRREAAAELLASGSWDWYCLRYPAVKRVIRIREGPERILPQLHLLPGEGEPLERGWSEWRRLTVKDYADLQWSYGQAPRLVCNGIIIPSVSFDYFAPSAGVPLRIPSVSVFDGDGKLPLNLQRSELTTREYPFQDELLRDVLRDYVAFSVITAPASRMLAGGNLFWYNGLSYPGDAKRFTLAHLDHGTWCSAPAGIAPVCAAALWNLGISRIILLPVLLDELQVKAMRSPEWQRAASQQLMIDLPPALPVVPIPCVRTAANLREPADSTAAAGAPAGDALYDTLSALLDGVIKPAVRVIRPSGFLSGPRDADTAFEVFHQIWRAYEVTGLHFVVPGTIAGTTRQLLQMTFSRGFGRWSDRGGDFVWSVSADEGGDDEEALEEDLTLDRQIPVPFINLVLRRRGEPLPSAENRFEAVWMETMGQTVIPYSPGERARLLGPVLQDLRAYVGAYRAGEYGDTGFWRWIPDPLRTG